MKFNRDIFKTTPHWAEWATLDQWGWIWVYEHQPLLSECGTYWNPIHPEARHHRIGHLGTLGLNLMPRRIRKP